MNQYTYPIYSFNSISTLENYHLAENTDRSNYDQPTPVDSFEEEEKNNSIHGKKKAFSKYKYAKKNVESNVINQCFSFLTTKAKSYEVTLKVLKS